MKINFDVTLFSMFGQPLTDQNGDPLSLLLVCIDALTGEEENPKKRLTGKEKLDRYNLANKIRMGGVVDLETTEIATIREIVENKHPVIIVGQVVDLLERGENSIAPAMASDGREEAEKIQARALTNGTDHDLPSDGLDELGREEN
jgi:Cu2+-containing amine oxidase